MKTKVAALITALLIIFVGAGGVYFLSRSKPEVIGTISDVADDNTQDLPENQSVRLEDEETPPIDTSVEDWFKLLGQELELETLDLEESAFEWGLETDTMEINGYRLTMGMVPSQTVDTVLTVFEDNKFEQDAYNLALGDYVVLYGYSKEDLVCQIRSTTEPESETEEVDLEISCGLMDLITEEGPTQEDTEQQTIIKNLFAEKYDRDVSTVYVDIIQSTPEHMSGGVQFIEPDEEQPTPGNAGAFLAATNEDGDWVLVFDGNGAILCSQIEPYDFPLEMVPECYDDGLGQVVDRAQSE